MKRGKLMGGGGEDIFIQLQSWGGAGEGRSRNGLGQR